MDDHRESRDNGYRPFAVNDAVEKAVKDLPVRKSPDSSQYSRDPHQPQRRRRRKRNPILKPFKYFFILIVIIIVAYYTFRVVDFVQKGTSVYISDAGFTHSDRFNSCAVLNGIDVSEHQGKDIKWKKVKSSGVDFAFIRAGYRSAEDGSLHADAQFVRNIKGASNAGIMTGAYFYSQATTPAEAVDEAEFLLDKVKKYDITMPLVIDFEIYPGGRVEKKIQAGDLYAASLYHDIVLAFCRRVEKAGYESAVYANLDMLTHYMDAAILDDEATLWLARYNTTADLDADYMFWQCSDQGRIGGYTSNVDHDFWYVEPGKVYKTRGEGIKDKQRISIGECHISFQRSVTKIKNRRAIPKLGITYEGRGLARGHDYQLSVVNNTGGDRGYIVVRGIGKYKNWMMVPFKIEDKSQDQE